MNPFELIRSRDREDALQSLASRHARHADADLGHASRPRFLAGGTNLVDLMKEGVMSPDRLVDVTRLPMKDITRSDDGTLELGAMATNADTARHPLAIAHAPLLRTAILAGASHQPNFAAHRIGR